MSVTKRLRKTTLISKKKAITHVRKWRSFYFDPLSLKMQETLFVIYCILCWPMRCEESCFCAMLIFLLMNRYETSSIESEISFKHFNCYRLCLFSPRQALTLGNITWFKFEFMPHQAGHKVLIFATDTQEVRYSIDLLSLLLRATYKWRNAWSCSKYWDVLFGSRCSIFTFRIRYKKPIIELFVVNCSPFIREVTIHSRKAPTRFS